MYKYFFCGVLTITFLLKCTNGDIINKNVERVIDLSSQLVKITSTITLENTGKSTESSFLIVLEPDIRRNLSYISVKDSDKAELQVSTTKLEQNKSKQDVFNVKLKQGLAAGRTTTVSLEYILTNSLIPFPKTITQKEKQLVRYFGNHYFYSPYLTTKQVTSVIVNSKNIESYTKLNPVSQSGVIITYGPYNNVQGLQISLLMVHFESNAPFLTVSSLKRHIDVSHWGNVEIEENIDVFHSGAKLKGSFSRYDYQQSRANEHHSIKSYKTILPAAAHSVYYRDSNGNISTSNLQARKDWIELELRPRYPLFGGWRTCYTLGYSVPSYQHLYKTPNGRYSLRMRVLDNVFEGMHVEELETSIVLPLGASNVKLRTPYEVQRLPDTLAYKYLDTEGRPVLHLKKANLVEEHIQNFEITYDWQPILFLYKPIMLSVFLYVLFLIVIVYVRLDFSLSKPEHVKVQ